MSASGSKFYVHLSYMLGTCVCLYLDVFPDRGTYICVNGYRSIGSVEGFFHCKGTQGIHQYRYGHMYWDEKLSLIGTCTFDDSLLVWNKMVLAYNKMIILHKILGVFCGCYQFRKSLKPYKSVCLF